MKCEVLRAHTDRETREVRFPGDTVELTETRAKELEKGGFVKRQAARRKAVKE